MAEWDLEARSASDSQTTDWTLFQAFLEIQAGIEPVRF